MGLNGLFVALDPVGSEGGRWNRREAMHGGDHRGGVSERYPGMITAGAVLGSALSVGAGAGAEARASATIAAADLGDIVRAAGQALGCLRLNSGGRPGSDSMRCASRNCGAGIQLVNNDSATQACILSGAYG